MGAHWEATQPEGTTLLMSPTEIARTDRYFQTLSLHGCNNLDSNLVKRLNDEQWHIPE